MARVERLPKQLEGRGFVVPVRFRRPYSFWIDRLVDEELFGYSNAEVTQRLFFRWIEDRLKAFAAFGIKEDDALTCGYSPVKFDHLEDDNQTIEIIHQRQPWKVELYGHPAYLVDRLTRVGLFGKTRVDVVKHGVEARLFDNFDHYSHWVGKKST